MTTPVCRECDCDLVCPDNWRPSLAKAKSYICTACRRAYELRRMDANPELRTRAKQATEKFRQNNPERVKATLQAWLDKHPGYMKSWRENRKQQQQGQ